MILTARVTAVQAGMRLDDGAARLFPGLSKSRIRKIIDWGGCSIAGTMVRVASRTLAEHDEIVLGVMEPDEYRERLLARDEILYDDRDYLAVNKAAGLNCQRTPYQLKGTVEHAVTLYFRAAGSHEPARVVHRLDRGTSGVMVFPKNRRAAAHFSAALQRGAVEKIYWALVAGAPDADQWTVNAPIAKINRARYGVALPGKDAQTLFRVRASGVGLTLVEARPLTGRTHQIRVHLAHCGLPILGDTVYGGDPAARLLLHCRSMTFANAAGRTISATAPVDRDFAACCAAAGIPLPVARPAAGGLASD